MSSARPGYRRSSTNRRGLSGALVVIYLSQLAIAAPDRPPIDADPPTGGEPTVRIPDYPTGSITRATAPIKLPGAGGVTDTGAATYALPIHVPAGPRGMQPSLTISYSAGTGNGQLGVGFGLGGLSTIAACRKTFASDGTADGIDFDWTDAYCLDGAKLVVDGSATPDGDYSDGIDATYHTEVEGFDRVIAHRETSAATQPKRFVVYRRDGTIATYEPMCGVRVRGVDSVAAPEVDVAATSAVCAIESPTGTTEPRPGSVAVSYPLRSVVDRRGNEV